jgi:hypothetical protein
MSRAGKQTGLFHARHEGSRDRSGKATEASSAWLSSAFVMRLIPDENEADVWLRMLDDRNLTSQAYDETLAVRIYTRIVPKVLLYLFVSKAVHRRSNSLKALSVQSRRDARSRLGPGVESAHG